MKNILHLSLLFVAPFTLLLLTARARGAEKGRAQDKYLIYVGTAIYEGQPSNGIYAYRFNAATGQLVSLGLVAESVNPGFLAVHPNRRFLYATNEVSNFQGGKTGGVSAFTIDRKTGKLTPLNAVSSAGGNPACVAVDKTGKYVLVANYFGGTAAVFPVLKEGRLGEASAVVQATGSGADPERQEGPHMHSIGLSPDNHFAIAADLGADAVRVYRFDPAKGSLVANDPPFAKTAPGAGPRHFAFSPDGAFVYVINELQSSISAFSYDAPGGVLHPLQMISTLPEDFKGENTAAEVQVHPTGKFLYASNRGSDNSIAVFAIDAGKGTLTLIERVPTQGKTPRNFEIDPTGAYLFAGNQDSDDVVVFRIDLGTGRLTPTGQVLKVRSPTCVRFVAIR